MAKFYTPTKLSENIRETPEGFLLCLGVPVARTGWQVYAEGETPLEVGPDGTVKVYRDWEEVSRPETIASFQGKSITIKHPEKFVAPDNWKELTKGSAQNVRKSDEEDENGERCLLADLLITEAMAIQLVKSGLREVSCGYEAEYEQTGEGEGRQFNIIGNHIALVEEGRAGSAYAINDHKGKVTMKQTLLEKLTKRFGAKVIDEVMAEEKKESKDEAGKEDKAKDAAAYDELVKMVKDLGEKIDGMGKGKDEKEEKPAPKKEDKPAKDDKSEEKSEDEESEGEASLEDRLKALEVAVAKLLEKQTGDEEESEDEESEEGEEKESEDEDSSMTGDTASRVEILAPGTKATKGVDVRVKALEAAYATEDGKAVIHAFTGGKKPVYDSAEKIATIFVAASEVLKAQRGTGLEKTKSGKAFDHGDSAAVAMTADKMNELNAAHWARK